MVFSSGIHAPSSWDAWSNAGWRERVRYASAQERVGPVIACVVGAAVGLEGKFEGPAWDEVGFSRVKFVEGGSWEVGRGRVAARDLQKSVLEEEDWHWAQVPGPLMQVFDVKFVEDGWENAGWVFW